MGQSYPETEAFALSFARAELTMDSNIYTAISSVSIDQETSSEAVKGTSPYPLSQTEGTMDLGTGTVTFSDERERLDFIDNLGEAYRNKLWTLSWVVRNTDNGSEKQIKCVGCRVTSAPIDHSEGAEALGGDINFNFINYTINGKNPH